ncbi:MAG: ABC transporter ATP-binding protein [Micropruina glycogenica]
MPTCWAGVVVRPDELQAGRVTAFVGAPVLITAIVGPNACGKSTLLRVLSRLLTPSAGQVVLDGRAIASYPSRHVARRLALLPQSSIAPDGITVTDLVGRGRFPYQSALRQSRDDEQAVNEAIAITGIADLADRLVDELSGGQRQRVWVPWCLPSRRR